VSARESARERVSARESARERGRERESERERERNVEREKKIERERERETENSCFETYLYQSPLELHKQVFVRIMYPSTVQNPLKFKYIIQK